MAKKKQKDFEEYNDNDNLRGFFIRVHLVNKTQEGIVSYTVDELEEKCKNLCDRYQGSKYALALHDKDIDADNKLKEAHVHIDFMMNKNNKIKWKYIKETFPYGSIQHTVSDNAALQYMLHKNNPEKTPYSQDIIRTNLSESKLEQLLSTTDGKTNSKKMVDDLLLRIAHGEIREYNKHLFIDDITLARNDRLFKIAFKNRSERIMSDNERNIKVIFICGTTGSGKTTLAKEYAKTIGDGSFYVSSSKNDSLQDYKGQEVLILDDLRDSAFEFDDILKMLDNHTASTVRSRFYNKAFLGSTIIITSTSNVFEWYANTKEDRNQLYRRIGAYVVMDTKTISTYAMKRNAQGNYFTEWKYTIDNYILEMFPDETEEDSFFDNMILMAGNASKVLSSMKASDDFKKEINDIAKKAAEMQKNNEKISFES